MGKEKKPETILKTHSISTNREKALLMEVRNKTIKSNKTDLDYFQFSQKPVQKSSEETPRNVPKIVNINKILMKTKMILRNVRKRLQLNEDQKTHTRKVQFLNDVTMEFGEQENLTKGKNTTKHYIKLALKKLKKLCQKLLPFLIKKLIFWRLFYMIIVIITSFFLSVEFSFKIETPLNKNFTLFKGILLPFLLINAIIEIISRKIRFPNYSYKQQIYMYFNSSFLPDISSFVILIMIISEFITLREFPCLLYLLQLYYYFPLYQEIKKKAFPVKRITKYINLH